MNEKFKRVFGGKIVNKRLTTQTGVDEFPRYVLEYLIDNYCTEENFQEDLQQVVRRLRENFVHGAEAEKIRHYIRENRNHTIIASLEVRLSGDRGQVLGHDLGDQRELRQRHRGPGAPVPDAAVRRHVGHDHADLRRDRGP